MFDKHAFDQRHFGTIGYSSSTVKEATQATWKLHRQPELGKYICGDNLNQKDIWSEGFEC